MFICVAIYVEILGKEHLRSLQDIRNFAHTRVNVSGIILPHGHTLSCWNMQMMKDHGKGAWALGWVGAVGRLGGMGDGWVGGWVGLGGWVGVGRLGGGGLWARDPHLYGSPLGPGFSQCRNSVIVYCHDNICVVRTSYYNIHPPSSQSNPNLSSPPKPPNPIPTDDQPIVNR